MSKSDFNEWFCLSVNRKNFSIDPRLDDDILFGRPEWEKQIDDRLKESQLLNTPIRLVWWGQYGIGKTHRLRHMQYLVKNRDYRYYPCYLVAADIQEKTGFERLHYELVSALGKDTMRDFVKSYFMKASAGTVPDFATICNDVADVRMALETFGGPSERPVGTAWQFLCGRKLDKSDLDIVGVGRPELERAGDYAAVIQALASIIEAETGKQLLYLIDEGENTTRITNRTAEARWNESIRALLDLNNLSIVLTVGAEKSDNLPVLILRPDIVRRIQTDNYVQMDAFKTPDADKFIRDLLAKWIDRAKLSSLEAAENLSSTVPDYDPEVYPFTGGGFQMFCDGVTVDPRSAKPSEIIAKLNNVAAQAYFDDRRLINRDHLTSMGFA